MKHCGAFIFVLLATLLFTGCSSTFEQNEQITGPGLSADQRNEQRNRLLNIVNFESRGSVELDLLPQSEYGSSANTRGSARYVYNQKNTSYMFAVTHAIAGVLLKVKSGIDGGGVELTSSDGQKYRFANDIEFMRAVHLPVSRLPYFILGISLGDETQVEFDDDGHLKSMVLQGWNVRYYEYAFFGTDILPKRLELRNSKVGTIRIVVDSWDF